jgi:hypothetical protein
MALELPLSQPFASRSTFQYQEFRRGQWQVTDWYFSR